MPKWEDYKAHAKDRGALAMECYVSVSTPKSAPEDVRSALPDHLAYQKELEGRGQLMMAGPMSDESGTMMEGVGLIIYRAPSLEDARQLALGDPMHKSGAREFTLRRWLVNEGSLSFTVNLSAQQVKIGD